LWLLVGLFLALVAGGLAFTAMLRATAAQSPEQTEPRAPVVIVVQNVPARTRIQPQHVELAEMPISAIPANAVRSLDAAVGKVTTSPLVAGEFLIEPRLADLETRGPEVAFELEPGKVIMAFPAGDLMSRSNILKPGDKVDVLVTIRLSQPAEQDPQQVEQVPFTFASLQRVTISAVVMPPEAFGPPQNRAPRERPRPEAILLALDPQDALLLKHLKDTGGIFDIVLRAPEDEADFETTPVDPSYLQQHYGLGTTGGE
jgi:pilus assembly protein CpaB